MKKTFPLRPVVAALAAAGSALALFTVSAPMSAVAEDGGPAAAPAPVAVCSEPPQGQLACQARVIPGPRRDTARGAAPQDKAALPAGYGPADIRSAYRLGTAVAAHAGKGRTIALVDAHDAPTLEADLAVYRSTYGLPACTTDNGCFRKVNRQGDPSPLPPADPSWAVESSLDVDAASAACPDCRILVVEADDASVDALADAVDTAVRLGATVVSNSYSAAETTIIEDPANGGRLPARRASYNHPGVPILAATGDAGFRLAAPYPADLTSVIAVGGTSLVRSDTARGWTETAWGYNDRPGGAGAACSSYIAKPAWQHDSACPGRTVADVSADADPFNGLAVYDSTPDPADGLPGGWLRAGGTSAATPLVAAMYAMEGRTGTVKDASGLYAHRDGLNDAVGGSSVSQPDSGQECPASSYLCSAVRGYDAPTGLGTPNGLSALRN